MVNRKTTPKEATVEAWGLIDGMPTGAHFKLRVYDDLVTEKSVTTPEMVAKVTAAWELSDNQGTKGGRRWHIGTRYGFADTYQTILDRRSLVERLYPATHDGTVDGQPVFLSPAENEKKMRDQGMGYYSQMLLNPAAGEARIFLPQWFKSYEIRPEKCHIYILECPFSSLCLRCPAMKRSLLPPA